MCLCVCASDRLPSGDADVGAGDDGPDADLGTGDGDLRSDDDADALGGDVPEGNNGASQRCARAVDKIFACSEGLCQGDVFAREDLVSACERDPVGFQAEGLIAASCDDIQAAICADPQLAPQCQCDPAALDCEGIYDCAGRCDPDDQECINACFEAGSSVAQSQAIAVSECLRASCPEGDQACIDENCTDEIQACFGPPVNLTCAQLNDCFQACPPDDQACYEDCFERASNQAQTAYADLVECAEQSCPMGDTMCLEDECGDELDACFDPGPPSFCLDICDPEMGACEDMLFCVGLMDGTGLCVAGDPDMPAVPPGSDECGPTTPCANDQICVPTG